MPVVALMVQSATLTLFSRRCSTLAARAASQGFRKRPAPKRRYPLVAVRVHHSGDFDSDGNGSIGGDGHELLDVDNDEEDHDQADYDEELLDLRLYLDSADVKAWGEWAETGLFYGFTTNPTILKRDGVACTLPSLRQLTRSAFDLGAQELQLQAWGSTAQELYRCGLDLKDLDSRIVVKLPITLQGARAAGRLVADGAEVTMTGVYAAHQVVTSLAMCARYCAPYVGRMTDAGKHGVDEAINMQRIVDQTNPAKDFRLLVASIRSADELAALAAGGCNTFTISPAVAQQLFDVELTEDAAAAFQKHAEEMGASNNR